MGGRELDSLTVWRRMTEDQFVTMDGTVEILAQLAGSPLGGRLDRYSPSIIGMSTGKSKQTRQQLTRSQQMARIGQKNTAPELRLRRALFAQGARYRLHAKLPGRPDIVFTRAKVAVFVDGCFWHGCPIHGTTPKTNTSYWGPKLEENVARDKRVCRDLESMGWLPLRLFEHEIGDPASNAASWVLERVFSRI